MGLTSSPGLARMVLLHLAKLMQKKYPLVYDVISSDTYVDDAGVFGESKEQVIETATQVILCLQEASFKSGKVLTDNRAIMRSIPRESLHPSIIQALENNTHTVPGSIGIKVEFDDPNIKDAVIEDAKQLGVHFMIDLQEEDSYLT